MPRSNFFNFAAVFESLATFLGEVRESLAAFVRIVLSLAFPAAPARTAFAGLIAGEHLVQARARARTTAYQARRLQREPLALSAGCGLALAV